LSIAALQFGNHGVCQHAGSASSRAIVATYVRIRHQSSQRLPGEPCAEGHASLMRSNNPISENNMVCVHRKRTATVVNLLAHSAPPSGHDGGTAGNHCDPSMMPMPVFTLSARIQHAAWIVSISSA
jgi:hypothetical protein